MQVAISEAKATLTEFVRRAQAGDEIVLTRHGEPTVRLVPIVRSGNLEEKRALLDAMRGSGRDAFGPSAARSADHLYDDLGLPG